MGFRAVYQRSRFIIALLVVVVIVHGALYARILKNFPNIASSNDTQYSNIATHIVRDGVFTAGRRDAAGALIPTASQPPLYPYLYATSYRIFGIGTAANEPMRILLMLANVGVIVVSWRIGLLFSARAAKFTAAFAASDLTAFYFAQNYDIPDTLLGFFIALWLLFTVRVLRGGPSPRNVLLGSLALGLAMMTKIAPFLLWVPFALLLAGFLWKGADGSVSMRLRTFVIFALVITFTFGGWKLRNTLVTGSSAFASGATTLRWNASYLVAYQRGISPPEARRQLAEQYFPDALLARGEWAVEREGGAAMARLIMGSPFDFGVVVLRAMPGLFFGTFPPYMLSTAEDAALVRDRIAQAHGVRTLLPQLWIEGRVGVLLTYALAKLHLLLLYGASAVAIFVLLRRRSFRWVLVLFVMTVMYTMVVSGASAQPRYRTMVLPICYVLGGYGLAYVWERWRAWRTSAPMAPAVRI